MAKQITLDEIKKLLEKGKPDTELLKTVNALMGLIVFFAPLAAGLPPGTADLIVEVLEKREALFKAGELLVEKLAKVGTGDEVDHYRRIEAAHLLITYSSFFDSVSKKIPGFWKNLALDEEAQKYLAQQASGKGKALIRVGPAPPDLPHPLTTFESHLSELRTFYNALNETLVGYLEVLKIVNIEAADKANEYRALKDSIAADSVQRYQAQYVELATKFPEFHIYANFHFQTSVDERLRDMAKAAASSNTEIDLGFQKLAAAIAHIGREPATETLADLRTLYLSSSEKPIWEKGVPGLTFPRRCDIFVPQAYRALRYRPEIRLDDEETWRSVPVNQDLGLFIERCIESPVSIEKPILILGAPGSGKSMLTHMIGSILGGRFDTIRVELSRVHPDSLIHAQIEKFISDETLRRQISWSDLQKEFKAPPVVILDGFDELLQATGKAFAAYLQSVQEFQTSNLTLGHSVRVIVTSRMNLINRAHVPEDAIVIRLEEFDKRRRVEWADVWNRSNQAYFSDPELNTKPFDLDALHRDLRHLSRQPLLLLMLAIYDAKENRLATQREWNRTALYHNLIRDFVEREERRTKGFDDLATEDQKKQIEKQMRRLGVAGLTMFNHRKREIRPAEVENALKIFELTYSAAKDQKDPKELSQAERLFGSFFFVLRSERAHSEDIVYEFLHPTFGEFLAAYTIASELIENCDNIRALKPTAQRDWVIKPDKFPDTWFECLIHAPLFNEPIVLDMFRDWIQQSANENLDSLVDQLRSIVLGQAYMLLEGTRFPDAFKPLPVLGHGAIYSANLVTMAAELAKDALVFDEEEFTSYSDETRPWDRLTFLWRSWFSLRVLANLGAAVKARRDGNKIRIERADKSLYRTAPDVGLDRLYTAASGLGDHVLLGLSGYFLADSEKPSQTTLDEVEKHLKGEGYALGVFSDFRRIPLDRGPESYQKLMAIVRDPHVPHWETWVRAIWMVTANQNCPVNWSKIPMIRELHRGHLDHLIAPVAHPDDAEALYSEHDLRPVQLQFAGKSGGKKRYRETYDRLLPELTNAKWLAEEYVAMLDAAEYFGDEPTADTLRKTIGRLAATNYFKRGLWRLTNPLFALPVTLENLWFPALGNRWPTIGASAWSRSGKASNSLLFKWIKLLTLKTVTASSRLHNPFTREYAKYLRKLKEREDGEKAPVRLLETCVGLPADVQIELIDIVRRLPPDTLSPELLKAIEFPVDVIGDITLDSLASARRVAIWLGNDEAVKAMDSRLGQQ